MDEFIISMGKYAGAIMSVIALFTLVAWKPITTRSKAKKAREEADQREQKAFREQVIAKLDSIGEDVGDLQCERLTQAHDHYMELGYCPSSTKQALCKMHQSYRNKGRNHLAESYEADILDLPNYRKVG